MKRGHELPNVVKQALFVMIYWRLYAKCSSIRYNLKGENKVKKALLLLPLLAGQRPPVIHHLTLCQQRICDRDRSVCDQGIRRKCALVVDFHIDGSSAHLAKVQISTTSITLPTMRKQLIVLFHLGSLEPF